MGVDKYKATYVLLVAREDSLRVTLQTCAIWTELVGLDVLGLRQVEILAIQLHPGHQTANREQVGVSGWVGEENKKIQTHTHTNKKRKKRKRDFIHKQIKENCKFGAAGHIQKAGVNIAQLRSGVSLATYKANHIAVIFLTKS